jgi:hypothetical protein
MNNESCGLKLNSHARHAVCYSHANPLPYQVMQILFYITHHTNRKLITANNTYTWGPPFSTTTRDIEVIIYLYQQAAGIYPNVDP